MLRNPSTDELVPAMTRISLLLIILGLYVTPAVADTPKIDRTIRKEPTYRTKDPKYGMLMFGSESKERVWLVLDGDVLYVDRNGSGDLTEADKKVRAITALARDLELDGYFFDVGEVAVGGRTHKGLNISFTRLTSPANRSLVNRPEAKAALAKDPKAQVVRIPGVDVEIPWLNGEGIGGRAVFMVGPADLHGVFQFGASPATAPVVKFFDPLEITFYSELPSLRVGRPSELELVVGVPGIGPGTFAMLGYEKTVPKSANPVIELSLPPSAPGNSPVTEKTELKSRCCMVNFRGPVLVGETATPGTAQIKLSFNAWREAIVAPTTHKVSVFASEAAPRPEQVAPELVASLISSDRKANLMTVHFSPDGARLFAAAYPSGVVQIWDVVTGKEIAHIDTPSGLHGSNNYALVTPDWKTLYVPVDRRTVKPLEQNGKKVKLVESSGEIRVWDLTSGKEKVALGTSVDTAPVYATLSNSGRFLVCHESPTFDTFNKAPPLRTVLWDVESGKKWPLCEGRTESSFAPDDRTIALTIIPTANTKTSELRLYDVGTKKLVASLVCPDPDKIFLIGPFSPDGSVVAVYLSGRKSTPFEVWFLDARTLETRGKLVGERNPEGTVWKCGAFDRDGGRFIAFDGSGNALVWNVAEQKLVRTIPCRIGGVAWRPTVSPDGNTLAVAWMPRTDPDRPRTLDSDPLDFPQSRVTLLDLTRNSLMKDLIAPPGFLGGLAFSPDSKTLALGMNGAVRLFDLTK